MLQKIIQDKIVAGNHISMTVLQCMFAQLCDALHLYKICFTLCDTICCETRCQVCFQLSCQISYRIAINMLHVKTRILTSPCLVRIEIAMSAQQCLVTDQSHKLFNLHPPTIQSVWCGSAGIVIFYEILDLPCTGETLMCVFQTAN